MTPYAAVFAMNVKLFLFYQNSVQDTVIGFGLLVYQCNAVKVRNCSFYHSPHVQLDDIEYAEYDWGASGFHSPTVLDWNFQIQTLPSA